MKQKYFKFVDNSMLFTVRNIVFTFLVFFFVITSTNSFSQSDDVECVEEEMCEEFSDTLYMSVLVPTVEIKRSRKRDKKFDRKYKRIEKKVIKVYPYAKAAGELMRSYDAELSKITNEKDQKKFIKLAEEELKRQFEGDLRDMTISEGVILIKLIDRETGDSSYELIQELKGGFSAFMWQGVARLFSHNLKDEYDPYDDMDDEVIEYVIDKIEFGFLDIEEKDVNALTAEMIRNK